MEQKLQYNPTKSYSTCKEFTNSFNKIEKEFVIEELKQLAGDKGLEPLNGGIKIRCLTNLANPQQCGTGYGNRTRLTDVKGLCPNR